MRSSLLVVLALTAMAQEPPPEPIFQTGTRLVEVEVVVRAKQVRPPGVRASLAYFLDSGPPFGPPGALLKGLTRDDFTLLDEGKPQPIAIFRAGPTRGGSAPEATLSPGSVSNRADRHNQPLSGVTAVVVDLLNTRFELTDYARLGLAKLVRSLGTTDTRIALYSLGEHFHILHDFVDDPQRLVEAAAELDQPNGHLPPDFVAALGDYGDLMALQGGYAAAADVHAKITLRAVKRIVQHLSGIPGRKNLIWMAQMTQLPPAAMALLQQANIVVYTVTVRGGISPELGTPSGGRKFFDALDLTFAVRAAEEDSGSAYVLGYYPAADMLDGKYHKIAVSLKKAELQHEAFEVHYRSGYLATKTAALPAPSAVADMTEESLDSTGIGLTAGATAEAQHPGFYDLRVTVDLHDIHLDRKDGRYTGAFDLFIPSPSRGTVKTARVPVDLTDEQLVEVFEKGLTRIIPGVESGAGVIRVVVRDRTTGVAGSLRLPVADILKN